MGSNWKQVTLGDVADIGSSKRVKSADYVKEGVPFFRSKEIIERHKGNEISTELFISEEHYNSIEEKFGAPKENDILLTSVGTLGVPYQVKKDDKFYFKDGNLTWFKNFKENVNPKYIYYWLTSQEAKNCFAEVTIGSTQQALTIVALKSIKLRLPPYEIQNTTVKHISALSDKLQLNRYLNKTLEQMAQALFKSWFIDFDPVFDNMLAKADFKLEKFESTLPEELVKKSEIRLLALNDLAEPDKIKASLKALAQGLKPLISQHATTHAHFPCEFEHNEQLGWIPKGWSIVQLSDITTELRRGISPKYLEEGGIQVVNQRCIRNHAIDFSVARRNNTEIRKVAGRELLLGDVLVNSTGVGTLGRMAQVNVLSEPTVVDSHVTVVRPDISKCPVYTFGQLMLANESRVEALGEGSTGQTELSRKILSEQTVILPPMDIASHIEGTFKSYAEKQISNNVQIKMLQKLRDTLLPKLISGELQISDVVTA